MNPALLSFCLSAFTIGTSELVIAGLLPGLALDLSVSVPTAGLLVTGYAIGVAIGGPVLSLLVPRLPRKPALLGLMAVFALGHLLCALAVSFPMLMVARVLAAITQGTFFGIAALLAVGLVSDDKRGSALSMLFGGLTLAALLGVPLGTAIGEALGWRAAFAAICAVSTAAGIAMAILLPSSKGRAASTAGMAAQFRALANRDVVIPYAIITTMFVGLISNFTFIAPMLTERAGIAAGFVPMVLAVFGIGSTAGMYLGGPLADRAPDAALRFAFPGQLLVFASIFAAGRYAPAMIALLFLLGLSFYATASTLQNRIISGAVNAPELASTLISTVANLGIALGAWVGWFVLSGNGDYAELPLVGMATAALTSGLAWFALGGGRRTSSTPAIESPTAAS